MISPRFGSGVRLAGVTTDMPLIATGPAGSTPITDRWSMLGVKD